MGLVGAFFVEQVFVQAPGFPDLAFEAVACNGCFEMTFGNGNNDLHGRGGSSGRHGEFEPYHPQRIGHVRMAVLEKPADERRAFQSFGTGECVPGSVHKG